jgi:hypothetical protein
MVLKVFLSSTSKDLDSFRKAVDTAMRRLKDLHCVRMEDWTARPGTPRAVCEAEVRESQLFIGILGHCYGSRPTTSAPSRRSSTTRPWPRACHA